MKIFRKVIRYWRANGFTKFLRRLKYEMSGAGGVVKSKKTGTLDRILYERFIATQPMLGFHTPYSRRRLNLVTDSINSGSLFGGVATAMIFSVLLAEKWDCDLRVITRTESAHKQNLVQILKLNGIPCNKNIEFLFADITKPNAEVPVGDDDVFLTTSWWTTRSVKETFGEKRIIYLLQEDERMFYPFGEDHLRCTETLKSRDIQFILNTQLLYDHFVSERFDNIRENGFWFEPSWPTDLFFYEGQRRIPKKNFFFYARPNNTRNLFYLGLEVISTAVTSGVLDPNKWDFYFVGKDIPNLQVTTSCSPKVIQNATWGSYAALIRQMDLGLCLMYTPHPSYPPLDLAASGAVVVTNQFGNKQNLNKYSKNILCRDMDVGDLVRGIEIGANLAVDYGQRLKNFNENGILRNWRISFETILLRLEKWP